MKDFIIKTGKRMLVFLLVVAVLFISIVGYQYLVVAVAPKYNPETMALNFEIVGSGDRNLVFIHGLTGSKNYWKRDLDTSSGTQ